MYFQFGENLLACIQENTILMAALMRFQLQYKTFLTHKSDTKKVMNVTLHNQIRNTLPINGGV